MAEGIIGRGSEHARVVVEGRARARELRDRWIQSMLTREITFQQLVEVSKNKDTSSLGKIKLIDLLSGMPRWTTMTAVEAMRHIGIPETETIVGMRRSPTKVTRFSILLGQSPDTWRARPDTPPRWPWNGKLTMLIDAAGTQVPVELLEDDPTTPDSDESSEAALESVFDDDDQEAAPTEDPYAGLFDDDDTDPGT